MNLNVTASEVVASAPFLQWHGVRMAANVRHLRTMERSINTLLTATLAKLSRQLHSSDALPPEDRSPRNHAAGCAPQAMWPWFWR